MKTEQFKDEEPGDDLPLALLNDPKRTEDELAVYAALSSFCPEGSRRQLSLELITMGAFPFDPEKGVTQSQKNKASKAISGLVRRGWIESWKQRRAPSIYCIYRSPIAIRNDTHYPFVEFEGMNIRYFLRDGEPWFFAGDVCGVLGLFNIAQAISRLESDEKDVLDPIISNDGDLNKGGLPVISESGLYMLVLDSRKPQAKPFQRWIRKDVIPSIRKTGKYELPQNTAQISPQVLNAQTHRPTQIDNAKKVNKRMIRRGGIPGVIDYNQRNCEEHTGFRPHEIVELARDQGLPYKERTSGKMAVRNMFPAEGAAMSLMDYLVNSGGHRFETVLEFTKATTKFYQGFIDLMGKPEMPLTDQLEPG